MSSNDLPKEQPLKGETMRLTNKNRRPLSLLFAILGIFALLAAACGDDDDGDAATDGGGETTAPEDTGDGETADGEQAAICDETIEIGWIPWDEDVAVTHLWKNILEEQGAEVELTQLDVAPVYQGVADGDLDLFLDAWLPQTHSDYWEQFGDQVEDLGVWYDQGTLNIAVPSYMDAETIGDLAGNADQFGGRIVGIEPGAGLMRVTRDEAIPTYGLDGYELIEGSTPAMLAELERSLDAEEPVVVTLWHPHWAYSAYDIKDLEDPEGAMGEAEQLHAIARSGFSEDCPTIAEWLGNFEMPDDSLASLEELMINEYSQGEEQQAVEEWLSDSANQELVDSWTSS